MVPLSTESVLFLPIPIFLKIQSAWNKLEISLDCIYKLKPSAWSSLLTLVRLFYLFPGYAYRIM